MTADDINEFIIDNAEWIIDDDTKDRFLHEDEVYSLVNNVVEEFCNHQWIPVSDRLPDTHCDVLVTKNNGIVVEMSYHAPFDTGKRLFQWWGFGKWIDQHSQVIAWILKPSPYKAD